MRNINKNCKLYRAGDAETAKRQSRWSNVATLLSLTRERERNKTK
jgi:hypothetical protein